MCLSTSVSWELKVDNSFQIWWSPLEMVIKVSVPFQLKQLDFLTRWSDILTNLNFRLILLQYSRLPKFVLYVSVSYAHAHGGFTWD